ncbi:hypothetical protein A2276_05700 [candidate division WOR-1 bacterium RIFOXYA12_FULL_43_27]|uniref:VWFA domain-containing protein n=1 Tax=candidate division WOR-1 bacterium RIFOXYC2_FULL_46_14 TaxID=1802587 RepID=A0A1F4U3G9_UNCSA|nr:MAG: hypothetical protein A2276_05700 [candidate division WOR-1 bacterium RIFOXYA12_FULL_43_27]OGC20160.1 MAG: hypothetical protein A2292_03705 [candidate division WOR-1 bacterium RIFOXYB2_FULL_46_45]OGC32103.1 MAG: hypothetical protein A2232_07745 [candidate division WOR-1 bacterium RIFOXYA2_FULL_46_56]OGC39504.1 MAG: hypothetical protein A2438_08105 [candidate division WOR-1 bacterium RIFOXYC2_FULL_46_14]
MKKILFAVLLVSLFAYGCGKVVDAVNPNASTTPATPPSTATSVTLSGGNVSASGTGVSFNFSAVDQDSTPLTNITLGNITAEVYDTEPSAASIQGISAKGVINVAFTDLTSGANTGKPIAITLTLDKSGSMGFDDYTYTKVTTLEAAARKFVDLMSSNSQAAVVVFDSGVSLEAAMTTDKNVIKTAINTREAYGGATAVYSAISTSISEEAKVNATNYTRAIIAMTDGQNNSGSKTEANVTAEAIANNIPVYTVGLFDNSAEATSYSAPLKRIALTTTGTTDSYYEVIAGVTALSAGQSVHALGALNTIYTNLQNALSNAYSSTCSLSSGLTAGQSYWLKLYLNYGSFIKTLVIPFTAK